MGRVMSHPDYIHLKEKLLRNRKWAWYALCVAIGLYVLIGIYFQSQGKFDPFMTPSDEPYLYFPFKVGFLALSAGNLWFANYLRNKRWGLSRINTVDQLGISKGDWEKLTQEERTDLSRVQKILAIDLTSWALSEAIAIYGFVLFFSFGLLSDLVLLIGIAALGLYLYRPQAIPKRSLDPS